MFQKLKSWIFEQVIWVEKNFRGLSGEQKKEIIIKRLDELVVLPWYLEWLDDLVIRYLVDWAVEKLNWISDWNFADTKLNERQIASLASSMNVPLKDISNLKGNSFEERLEELYKQYGIEREPETVVPPVIPPVATPEEKKPNFYRCIDFSLKWEGGANFDVVDGKAVLKPKNKNDKGGPTKYGITWATLKAAFVQGVVSHNDIVKLTLDEAKEIYKKNYWDRFGWEDVAFPACLCCLDICILHGGFAWILQRAVNDCGGNLEVDGKFGSRTRAGAVEAAKLDPVKLSGKIADRRAEYCRNIVNKDASQNVFINGWLRRVEDMRNAAK